MGKVKQSSFRAIDITMAAMFVALMAIGANIGSFLVIGGILPITLQTFFSILAGALLGSKLGAISMTVYMFVGLVGVPVFARFSGGLGQLFSPTLGFVISFIFVAYVTGKIIESRATPSYSTFFIASLTGLVINYFYGTTHMYVVLQFIADAEALSYGAAWATMALPFVKDFVLIIVATLIAPRIYEAVSRSRNRGIVPEQTTSS